MHSSVCENKGVGMMCIEALSREGGRVSDMLPEIWPIPRFSLLPPS
jgi:hypothetical protein